MQQALAWLAEDDRHKMIVAYRPELKRLRDTYPDMAHQFVPMPRKGERGATTTNIFIDEMHKVDERWLTARKVGKLYTKNTGKNRLLNFSICHTSFVGGVSKKQHDGALDNLRDDCGIHEP